MVGALNDDARLCVCLSIAYFGPKTSVTNATIGGYGHRRLRSSCGAHTIDIPCGARPVPEQEPHRRRTVSVGAPCGLFTSAVRYDPGISHGRRTASPDM